VSLIEKKDKNGSGRGHKKKKKEGGGTLAMPAFLDFLQVKKKLHLPARQLGGEQRGEKRGT